jgi:hypothetical protein
VRVQVRVSLVALVVSALVFLGAGVAGASAAGFGFEKFFAGNCNAGHETCGEGAEEGNATKAKAEGFTQAGGYVPFGVTDFRLKTEKLGPVTVPAGLLSGESLTNLRVDVAPGVVTNPQAVEKCSMKSFLGIEVAPGVFTEPAESCENAIIGEQKVETVLKNTQEEPEDVKLSGNVYNLEQATGQGSTYGVALVVGAGFVVHTIIQGSVEYNSDYHDYFVIKNISAGLIESRLVFFGNKDSAGEPDQFIRNPTKCTAVGPETTTTVTGESGTNEVQSKSYPGFIGTTECGPKEVAFSPKFSLLDETNKSDAADGITTELTDTHPEATSEEPDSADLESVTVKMPEGMTINPSSAAGLEACTPAEAGVNTGANKEFKIQKLKAISCPASSRLGTFDLEVPTLPEGSLQGPVYLAEENGSGTPEAITKAPYHIYLDAETSRYGIRVLLKGTISPNASTGRLTATFEKLPQAPFNDATLRFKSGAFAPIANPLVCENGHLETTLVAYTGLALAGESLIPTTECPSSGPSFTPEQSTTSLPGTGGSGSNFTFNLVRPEGQQYVKAIKTVLPPGVVGKIPTVPQCADAAAEAGTCPEASRIGTVRVLAGSGKPFQFTGKVFLTEAIKGAPYGLSIVVPVEAGPVNLGNEVTLATIQVEQRSSRVVVTDTLPTIKAGIPVRLRSLSVEVNRPNYILNPTNCGELKTESLVTPVTGPAASNGTAVQVNSPFQVEGCGALGFKPTFAASTSGKPSKANGASLVTTMTQAAGQANIASVFVQLPKQLPSRLSTLNKACLVKTFEENPYSCSKESMVGEAVAVTPVLPNVMKGPAIFVSHAGEEFPSLELVLEADGVRVIVEGKTHIKKGITTTDFATTPDVPVSSITVSLPLGPFSALAPERTEGPKKTNLCTEKLVMPTTITGQNGVVVKKETIISPTECGVQILKQKVKGNADYVTVQTYSAGRVSITGSGLATTRKTFTGAKKTVTIKVPLTKRGRARRRPFKVKVRVGFTPTTKGVKASAATATVKF